MRVAITFLLLMLLPVSVAHAEKRVALVIGNGAYANVGKLPNPPSDADAMATLFRKAGFDVVEAKRDLALGAMHNALSDFYDRVQDADIAVVFFAGHGIEVNGTNYLIPIDAKLARDIDVEVETISLDRVTQLLEKAKRLRLVILDACRDNPFVRSMKRTSRSIGRGLAEVRVLSTDTLIAFAAKAGSTAADGDGSNSPYTMALVSHLTTPGLDLRLALGRVRDEVLKTTGKRQEPFLYGSLGGAEISLVAAKPQPQPPPEPTAAGPARLNEAAAAWAAVKETTNIALLEEFITDYQGTFYAKMARARIDELNKPPQAVAVPEPPIVEPPDPKVAEAARAWDKIKNTTDINALDHFYTRYHETPYGRLAIDRIFELGQYSPAGKVETPVQPAKKQTAPPPSKASGVPKRPPEPPPDPPKSESLPWGSWGFGATPEERSSGR